MTREAISREPWRLGQFLLVAVWNFAQRDRCYSQWFGDILYLTCNRYFDNFRRFAPKRRSLPYKQTKSALRIKFEDNPDFGSGLDPRVPLRRITLKDL